MSDEQNLLFGGEKVVLVVRRHPIVLLKPSAFPLLGIVFVIGVPAAFSALLFFAASGYFAYKMALWWLDRYVLTTNRIISTAGLFTKQVVSMPLGKITDLMYTRSIAGRLLGYGRLHLESAGQVGLESIDHLPNPDHFYRTTMSLALGLPTGAAPSPSENKDGHVVQLDVDEADIRERGQDAPLVNRSDD